MKKIIKTDKGPNPSGPYSQAVRVGSLLFVSGQVGKTLSGHVGSDVKAQTRQALENIKTISEAAGTSLDHVVKTTVFLADIKDFEAMNEVYAKCFADPPARSTVAVKGIAGDFKVEIEAVAFIPKKRAR